MSALSADILDASQVLSCFSSRRAVDPERLSNLFQIPQPVRVWSAISLYLMTRNHSLLLASSGWGQRWERWWWGQQKCCLSFMIILEQSWRNQGDREVDLEGAAPKRLGPWPVSCISSAIIPSFFGGSFRSSSVIIKTGSGRWL